VVFEFITCFEDDVCPSFLQELISKMARSSNDILSLTMIILLEYKNKKKSLKKGSFYMYINSDKLVSN